MPSLSDFALTLTMLGALLVGGTYWYDAVQARDARLAEVADCADAAGTQHGDEWRTAWDACWGDAHGPR